VEGDRVTLFILYWYLLGKTVHRAPGDKWMITGPAEYIPRIEVGRMEKRLESRVHEGERVLLLCEESIHI
jgi:hypothetical protein